MRKVEMVARIAAATDLTNTKAEEAVETILATIKAGLHPIVSGTNFAWGRERSGHAIDLCRNVRIRMTRRPAWLLPRPPR